MDSLFAMILWNTLTHADETVMGRQLVMFKRSPLLGINVVRLILKFFGVTPKSSIEVKINTRAFIGILIISFNDSPSMPGLSDLDELIEVMISSFETACAKKDLSLGKVTVSVSGFDKLPKMLLYSFSTSHVQGYVPFSSRDSPLISLRAKAALFERYILWLMWYICDLSC